MKYVLQNRWKLTNNKLTYYGLRNRPFMFKNTLTLKKVELTLVKNLPCSYTLDEVKRLHRFIGTVIVEEKFYRSTPNTYESAQFCKQCSANDFMIPGLEFDAQGLCPMCQTKDIQHKISSLTPIVNVIPSSPAYAYDVALFYTGGKDSSYLLYYLAKVLKLRVLALTWEIPFMSSNALQSIQNARQKFPNVTFMSRSISYQDQLRFDQKLYQMNGNVCACPSLAYVLFYPDLVKLRVPYLVAGNEPAQLMGLYYNHLAPLIAYRLPHNKWLRAMINLGRILTLHRPLKNGQFQTLATMKQLAFGDPWYKRISKYKNGLVANISLALQTLPDQMHAFQKIVRTSSLRGHVPRFVQIDFNAISGGVYDWRKIKQLIIQECGWVGPKEEGKGLHTSCKIERCKEYTQYKRFYDMESTLIPFSALEISLASSYQNISQQEAILEMKTHLGFSLEEVKECHMMHQYLKGVKL